MYGALLTMSCLVGTIATLDGQDDDIRTAIAGEQRANHAKFAFGSIRYTFTDGTSSSPKDAREGMFQRAYTSDASYFFDGENRVVSQLFPDDALKATTVRTGPDSTSCYLNSFRALTNGRLTLHNPRYFVGEGVRLAPIANLTAGPAAFERLFQLPIDLEKSPRSRLGLEKEFTGLKDRSKFSVQSGETLEGRDVVKIVLDFDNSRRTYWFDLERGAIPVRILDVISKTNTGTDIYHDDIRLVPGHGWMPFVRTVYVEGRAFRTRIDQADFASKPRDDVFRLTFDEPVPLVNPLVKRVYAARQTWDLNHLPSDNSPDSTPQEPMPTGAMGSLQPGERDPSRLGTWLGLGLVVLASIGSYFWIRRRVS